MKLSDNTVLITGATSGIGLELALQLMALSNTVIVTGRNEVKLQKIAAQYPFLHTIQSDVSDPKAIATLYQTVVERFPGLNILINNAGIMRKINLQGEGSDLNDIGLEIETNLLGPIRMVKQFLPILSAQPSAAIVNVSSGLAFSPFPISPIYCATKAGIHSFTQSLRVQLKNSKIKVFELAPPATDTPLQSAFTAADLKVAPMMELKKMVAAAINGLRKDRLEILPGLSKVLRAGSRIAPNLMIKMASGPVDAMLSETNV
ncbi:SDR family oxidoreductase [Granulicella sp. L60]|uniref:SDR family oxidoreductase n=1 Tax=Granulicella sp. L60 TaxID=1641866 RepID=UPI00131DE5CC|nr:SDR family NAD(P)-dependent oxidoreductase [Granulicella sp. L60]